MTFVICSDIPRFYGASVVGDAIEESLDQPPHLIELVDTVESELSLMDWGVHEASGIDRRHVHP